MKKVLTMASRENFSKKRMAILDTLTSTTVHPTAEWVYTKLKPEYTDLSLGTVYRNIKIFCAQKKAKSVGVINGQEHFDADMSPHSHFVCKECGMVLDVEKPLFDANYFQMISRENGFLIEEEEVMLKGLCKNCNKIN